MHLIPSAGAAAIMAAIALVGLTMCPAEDATAREDGPPRLTRRIYDVTDLMDPLEAYPLWTSNLPSTSGEGPPPRFEVGDVTGTAYAVGSVPLRAYWGPTDEPIGWQELVDVIQRTVNRCADADVALWSDEGGPAAIEFIYGGLLVTQTQRGHERLAELLAMYREHHLTVPIVTVEAKWVLLDPGKATDLLRVARPHAGREINEEELKQVGAEVVCRGRITCLNGQTVHLGSGRIVKYLADVEPVLAKRALGADTTISTAFMGTVLQVRPTILDEGDAAVVDLRSHVWQLKEMREKPLPHFGRVKNAHEPVRTSLDLPQVLTHAFRTTARLPLDRAVLVGGMTAPEAKDGKVLCLVLKVTASK